MNAFFPDEVAKELTNTIISFFVKNSLPIPALLREIPGLKINSILQNLLADKVTSPYESDEFEDEIFNKLK